MLSLKTYSSITSPNFSIELKSVYLNKYVGMNKKPLQICENYSESAATFFFLNETNDAFKHA